MTATTNVLQKLPSVDRVLEALAKDFPEVKPLYLKRQVRFLLDDMRANPQRFHLEKPDKQGVFDRVVKRVAAEIRQLLNGSLQPVINATGVVLHTGLGRAPLNGKIAEAMAQVSRYANLELDLPTGKRGQRNDHLAPLLRVLTGAEDGFAVNNNAAAVLLMLNTVGNKKEIILSRGEMIEIGGSFRLPEVMRISGVKLREIGTTNKTHLRDYADAINARTAGILLCHTSNYEVQGFTHKPAITEIVALAKEHNLPVIYDLGSGSFAQTSRLGGIEEPEVTQIVQTGVDLISFSGDKLLGGPQAGIIVGKKYWVQKCAKNHLLRALRLDKFMIKAIQQTLIQYLYAEASPIPLDAHGALLASKQELEQRSKRFVEQLPPSIRETAQVVPAFGKVGSGAYPTLKLPSFAIRIQPRRLSAARLSKRLRLHQPPVIGYVEDDALHLDLRTVSPDEEAALARALQDVLGG